MGHRLLAGEVKTSKFLRKKIAPFVKGLEKDADGVFIKKGKGAPAPELAPDANGVFELTDANWDEAIAKNNYFVKFYAPWCSMCKKLEPFWNKVPASLTPGANVRIAKIDATKEMKIANKYEIKSYPTLKVIGLSTGFTKAEIAVDFSLKKMKGDGQEAAFLANWGGRRRVPTLTRHTRHNWRLKSSRGRRKRPRKKSKTTKRPRTTRTSSSVLPGPTSRRSGKSTRARTTTSSLSSSTDLTARPARSSHHGRILHLFFKLPTSCRLRHAFGLKLRLHF